MWSKDSPFRMMKPKSDRGVPDSRASRQGKPLTRKAITTAIKPAR